MEEEDLIRIIAAAKGLVDLRWGWG